MEKDRNLKAHKNCHIKGRHPRDEYLEKLTDFWEINLLFKYKRNSKLAHQCVDKHFNKSIEQKHFGIWLNLWFETTDQYFEAELADRAKNNARKMASHIFMSIYMDRNTIS